MELWFVGEFILRRRIYLSFCPQIASISFKLQLDRLQKLAFLLRMQKIMALDQFSKDKTTACGRTKFVVYLDFRLKAITNEILQLGLSSFHVNIIKT